MKQISLVVTWTLASFIACGLLWYAFLPYPLTSRLDGYNASKYTAAWGIPKTDYDSARALVSRRLRFYEFIQTVDIERQDQITFTTLKRANKHACPQGRVFTARRERGSWVVKETGDWIS